MRHTPPSVPIGESFDRLKALVIERTGHFYYEDKPDLLWERARKRLSATRAANLDRYLERLTDPDTAEAEWIEFEAELTIGETYFFRYPEQFEALRRTILPELIEANRERKRLRIWSAGCATGAEAYTLAIVVQELLGEAAGEWRISILGTDINERFLAEAREARYGRWALRSLSPDQRNQWFNRSGETWQVKAAYRSWVRFQRGNLLDLLGPAAPLELVEFDLILCRNVLIYFHPEMVIAVAGALIQRLAAQGWLLVGHAEPSPEFARIADVVSFPGTVAYRPGGAPVPDKARGAEWPAPPPMAELVLPPPAPLNVALPPPRVAPPPLRPMPQDSPAPIAEVIAELRRRADVGDYKGAEMKCREGLALKPDDPVLHFYHGLVEQALGRPAAAEDALRRAAYLDSSFIMAVYHLGLVRLERGQVTAGRRSIAAAAKLAGTLAISERLPEGAGLTAGELREMARIQLEAGAAGASDGRRIT